MQDFLRYNHQQMIIFAITIRQMPCGVQRISYPANLLACVQTQVDHIGACIRIIIAQLCRIIVLHVLTGPVLLTPNIHALKVKEGESLCDRVAALFIKVVGCR